jgi:hypothetical protein
MFENPVTACRAEALAKAEAETTPKPKKTASLLLAPNGHIIF